MTQRIIKPFTQERQGCMCHIVDYCPKKERAADVWGRQRKGGERFKSGFERLRVVFEPLLKHFRERRVPVATIAGTNGKGETAHLLMHHLRQEGANCALWTSPHVLSLRERFVYNGEPASYDELEQFAKKSLPLVNELSFYEFYFFVFCQMMARRKHLDFLILEVGMGGLLDAVNLFDAEVAAVVSVSLDHCQYLGTTREQILRQKLGVARPGKALWTSLEVPRLRSHCAQYASQRGIPWEDIFDRGEAHGEYPQRNDLLARRLVESLTGVFPPPATNIFVGRGRRERMTLGNKRFIFIGAHNPDGFAKMAGLPLAGTFLTAFSERPLKDVWACLETLAGRAKGGFVLCRFEHPRAMGDESWKQLGKKVANSKKLGSIVEVYQDWKEALEKHEEWVVCGSYYFIGEVQKHLLSHHAYRGSLPPG